MNLSNLKNKIAKFPNSPGVYIFKSASGEILYIGKATSLRDRVRQYFSNSDERGERIFKMVEKSTDIKIIKTDSVLEALILESNLIKKHQPKYNIERKDDKSFSYVLITREDFPRILILRKTELDKIFNFQFSIFKKFPISKFPNKLKIKNSKLKIEPGRVYGPYTSKKQLEIALKIIRKIFPYHSRNEKSEKGCLDFQLGLCSGPYVNEISQKDYQKNILGIKMILEGKKKGLISKLKKEMLNLSRKNEFEKAAEIRNKIFALQHIQDVALISEPLNENLKNDKSLRIEGYDISNISGKFAVGSMVVFDNSFGELKANKNEYRKFKIKTLDSSDDTGMMREVIQRRFANNWPASTRSPRFDKMFHRVEAGGDASSTRLDSARQARGWPKPNLIILDGGVGHLNMVRKVLRNYKLEIPILAVAKGPTRKKIDLRTFGKVPNISESIIEKIRDEAHRFAITYHRKLRDREFI